MPISEDTTNPSLRECVAGFAAIGTQNPCTRKRKKLDTRLVSLLFYRVCRYRSEKTAPLVGKARPCHFPLTIRMPQQVWRPTDSPTPHITPESIVVGSNGVACHIVNCVELLSSTRLGYEKTVFEKLQAKRGAYKVLTKAPSRLLRGAYIDECANLWSFPIYQFCLLYLLYLQGFDWFDWLGLFGLVGPSPGIWRVR